MKQAKKPLNKGFFMYSLYPLQRFPTNFCDNNNQKC